MTEKLNIIVYSPGSSFAQLDLFDQRLRDFFKERYDTFTPTDYQHSFEKTLMNRGPWDLVIVDIDSDEFPNKDFDKSIKYFIRSIEGYIDLEKVRLVWLTTNDNKKAVLKNLPGVIISDLSDQELTKPLL